MTARRTWLVVGCLVLATAVAGADVKPQKVDIKPFRGDLVVLQDALGGTYVVKPHVRSIDKAPSVKARIWYAAAKSKELYEQDLSGHSRSGDKKWAEHAWAPRIPHIRPATLEYDDGVYSKMCGEPPRETLTQLTGDKANAVLDKYTFWTEFMVRRAVRLARDDTGRYYYVDRLTTRNGGGNYRVFVGKKGAMKQLPLTDVAVDTAGEVFATKTGDLRLVTTNSREFTVAWIRGNRRTELIYLDVDANSPLIYSELGLWNFMGTMCDKPR
jgi:hypothetical protein